MDFLDKMADGMTQFFVHGFQWVAHLFGAHPVGITSAGLVSLAGTLFGVWSIWNLINDDQ